MSNDEQIVGSSFSDLPIQFQMVAATVLLFILSVILWSITGEFAFGFSERIEVLGTLISAVLTLGLLYVYRIIADIQKEQTTIEEEQVGLQEEQNKLQKSIIELQESQQEYIEASHKPVLQINTWYANSDSIVFTLKNKGNGLAKNPTVTVKVAVLTSTPSGELYTPINHVLNGSNPEGIHPYPAPVHRVDELDKNQGGAVIQPKSENNEADLLRANIQFQRKEFRSSEDGVVTTDKLPFSDIYEKVHNYNEVMITIVLKYEDILGVREEEQIYSETIEPEDEETLEQVIESPEE